MSDRNDATVPSVLGDLLAASTQFTGSIPRRLSHEQNIAAIMHIVRRKAHPHARLKKHVDGSYTITIPAPQQHSTEG